jgi:hypothetical protein
MQEIVADVFWNDAFVYCFCFVFFHGIDNMQIGARWEALGQATLIRASAGISAATRSLPRVYRPYKTSHLADSQFSFIFAVF